MEGEESFQFAFSPRKETGSLNGQIRKYNILLKTYTKIKIYVLANKAWFTWRQPYFEELKTVYIQCEDFALYNVKVLLSDTV